MRIALITDGIWPYVLGGMQKHSYYLCKYLAKNKVHVDLYHFNQSELNIQALEVFSEEEKKYIRSFVLDFPSSSTLPGHYLRDSYQYSKHIFELLRNRLNEYDFIYAKGFSGWYLVEQKKLGNIKCAPVGVKFHGYEMFQKAPDLKTKLQQILFLRKPVKTISQHADVVFSYGGNITTIIKHLGVKEQNIIELPSGVEESTIADQIKLTSKPIKFLYLGRYERRKGIEELNQAILALKKSNCEFHFVGPIPEEKRIKNDIVFYHGEIRDKQKLNSLIKSCDVLLCPSWSEGMPNVILEAMANGLAIAATNVGATSILVSEKSGWLLPSSDPVDIKKLLNKIIVLSLPEIDQKKQAALEMIRENFTWEKIAERLIEKLKKFRT